MAFVVCGGKSDCEAVAYWRKASPEEKMRTVGELITAAYAMKGIDMANDKVRINPGSSNAPDAAPG